MPNMQHISAIAVSAAAIKSSNRDVSKSLPLQGKLRNVCVRASR